MGGLKTSACLEYGLRDWTELEESMKKAVIITNAPSPYRVAFFNYLQKLNTDYSFHVLYATYNEQIGRAWEVDEADLLNHSFLKCKVITLKRRYDDKRIVLTYGAAGLLKRLSPDIVICMEYNVTILQAVHWCQRNRVPFVSWSDGTANSEKNISSLQLKFRHYIIRRAASFIGSSTATKEHQIAMGADPKKCHISLLTVDIDRYLMKKPEKGKISGRLLYVGGLIGRKGVDLLIDALPFTDQTIRLVIVGDGGEGEELKKQAKRLLVDDRIEWMGYLEGQALKDCYANCDAFILPTREDCFGLVILEAMCASLPVIASKYADGAKDLIQNGIHGKVVDPYQPKELALCINDLFADTEGLFYMQKACYERAKQFRFDRVAEGFFEALSDAAD